MAKPSRDTIQNGLNGWDGTVNNNFIRLFDNPFPVFLHTGDETDLEASFPAAAFEECIVVVDHTVLGLQLYVVDKNHPSASPRWVLQSAFAGHAPIVRNVDGTLDWDERVVIASPAAGTITLTLRPAGEMSGKTLNIKNVSATDTVDVASASLIDGFATLAATAAGALVTQFQAVTLYSDGATYHIL